MTARHALRVRRYLEDELDLEYDLTHGAAGLDAVLDAEWCAAMTAAGRRWRIEIDDPAGDISTRVVLHGGAR